jgi:His/Glu/Gln/Arg/opine family amino acid ABC transporter permease subunit
VSFDIGIILQYLPQILHGLAMTVMICAVSLPIGFALGSLICMARMSRHRTLRNLALAVIEFFRNTPFLIQVFIVFYVLPFYGLRMKPLGAGILCLSIYGGAYFAEIIRGAILSVPRGQVEAAQALGLSYREIMVKVVFPQMLSYLIPPVTNISITLIKESSVLSVITVTELTYISQFIIGKTFAPVEMFTVVALIYWSTTALFSLGMKRMETRFARIAVLGRVQV